MLIALTRPVSASLGRCQLTHVPRVPIDIPRAIEQHAAYEAALESLGAKIVRVPAAHELPDAVFIEDTAVVLDELAIVTIPGAPSRRTETAAVAEILETYRPVVSIEHKGTLDGGDVLQIGRTLYVGVSARSNKAGIAQLAAWVRRFGYRVEAMALRGCLHLKSAVTQVADDLLLVNPAWLAADSFPGVDTLAVDPAEPFAANALRIGRTLIYPDHFPRTREKLEKRRLKVAAVPCDELAKAEGAVTCCSILLEDA